MQSLTKIHRCLFYLLILLVPTQLTKHFWPSFAFISGIRIDYLAPTIYLTDILVALVLFVWLMEWLRRGVARPVFERGIEKNTQTHQQKPTCDIKSQQRINIYYNHFLTFLCRNKLTNKKTAVKPNPNNTVNTSSLSTRTKTGITKEAKKTNDKLLQYSASLSSSPEDATHPCFTLLPLVILVIFIYSIVNIFFAVHPQIAFFKWLKIGEMSLLALYVIKTKPDLLVTCYLLLVASLYSIGLAWLQFFKGGSIGGLLYFLGERTFSLGTPGIARQNFFGEEFLRPYAAFPHPNVLAGFLTATLPLLLNFHNSPNLKARTSIFRQSSLNLKARTFKFKPISLISNVRAVKFKPFLVTIMVAIWLGTIFITGSQAALLVSVGVILCYLSNRQRKYVLISSAIVLIIFLITNYQPAMNRIYSGSWLLITNYLKSPSFTRRYNLNIAALKMIKESPVVGVGLNNFIVRLPAFYKSNDPTFFLQPVHNIYLLTIAEGGLVGLVLLLWLILKVYNISIFKQIPNPLPAEAAPQALQAAKSQILNRFRIWSLGIGAYLGQLEIRSIRNSWMLSLTSMLLLGLFDHYLVTLQQGLLLSTILVAFTLLKTKKPRTA